MTANAKKAEPPAHSLSANTVEWLRVYPPLAIARVGNADPGESNFVIGPETIGGAATTPDGKPARYLEDLRTAKGEIKRQAARFRVYAKQKSGAIVELTARESTIAWTVAVANLKAGWYQFNQAMDLPRDIAKPATRRNAMRKGASRPYLDITPAPQQISGTDKSDAVFGDGSFWGKQVYLGELRTDAEGRLLFLGGAGASASFRPGYSPITFANNDGWHDDICDGPVRASVTFADGTTMEAEPGYVVATPPNFAPGLFGVVTMDDAVRETFMAKNWLARPTQTSFTRDVWPIFDRLTGLQWVDHGLFVVHGTGSPLDARDANVIARLGDDTAANAAWRHKIFALFRNPGDDAGPLVENALPQIFGDAYGEKADDSRARLSIAATQYWHLKNWAEGQFKSDWQGIPVAPAFEALPPADQIEHLNRASLHDCLGGPFHPGIELTWTMRLASVWNSAYRLKILPGTAPAHQDLGDELTPAACLAAGGPYDGIAAGALTRFLGVPWQTDGTSCNSDADYAAPTYLSMPTFWGARVPDQVLSLSDYERAASLGSATRSAQMQKHFTLRADWLRDVRGHNYFERLQKMIAEWASLGMVLPVKDPPQHLPAETRVELGRNVPGYDTFKDEPKYKLVAAVEALDEDAELPKAAPHRAEIEKASKVEAAAPARLLRRFRRGEV
jgi:L-Lysine epsilon oxidase N-terminal/L-lysine epsilon oxidase C-terminal domain